MAVNHVINLLDKIESDEALRFELYNCFDQVELIFYLNSRGYFFNDDDIDNAINLLHIQCQSFEEAQSLLLKADWLRFLISSF